MPVEIKELVIRMTAQPPTGAAESASASPGSRPVGGDDLSQEALVEVCVKQVLAILERKRKR